MCIQWKKIPNGFILMTLSPLPGLNLESIREARARIRASGGDICIETPILRSSRIDCLLSDRVGRTMEVVFKADHLQPVGAFKIRGALNFALSLDQATLSKGLTTHSSGNHGSAVAQVGQFLGVPVVVVCPRNAPTDKVDRMKYYGAEIVFCEPTLESRVQECEKIVRERRMTEIPPFNHIMTMAGQGTMALEISDQVKDLDAYIVAVGGCGLMSGIIVAAKSLTPEARIFGAEPRAVDDLAASLREGKRRGPTDPGATTICDALRVPVGPLCFEVVSRGCDGVFIVDDSETQAAMRMMIKELKQVTEPSGAVATAALFSDECVAMLRGTPSIKKICVVICGGNISIETLKDLI